MNSEPKYRFIDSNYHDFECPICLEIMEQPILLHGKHMFCLECIEQWREDNNPFACPNCRISCTIDKCVLNQVIMDKINNLSVHCLMSSFNRNGCISKKRQRDECTWTGKLIDLKSHQKDCSLKIISCPFHKENGETFYLTKSELQDHINSCAYRSVECVVCNRDIKLIELEKHLNYYCPMLIISCQNEGCNATFCRHEKEQHDNNCRYKEIMCDYFDKGCTKIFKRSELNVHYKNNAKQHLELVLKSLNELKLLSFVLQQFNDEINKLKKQIVFYNNKK